jgi:hypothetical protein
LRIPDSRFQPQGRNRKDLKENLLKTGLHFNVGRQEARENFSRPVGAPARVTQPEKPREELDKRRRLSKDSADEVRAGSAGWFGTQVLDQNCGDGPDTEPRRKARGRDSR